MIISVASGKGGTGKTLVATSLALSLESICRSIWIEGYYAPKETGDKGHGYIAGARPW